MKIGYIRVSTEEQNTARQEVLLRELGVDEVFIDKASGKNADRSELTHMMNYVRRGDTVIVGISFVSTLLSFPCSNGSKLIPTGLPVNCFIFRITSLSSVLGNP